MNSCVILSAIHIAAPTGVPPAADTDCRLAQPVTPETVYSPTLAGRLSKPRNFILCSARAAFEPTTSSSAVQCLTKLVGTCLCAYDSYFTWDVDDSGVYGSCMIT